MYCGWRWLICGFGPVEILLAGWIDAKQTILRSKRQGFPVALEEPTSRGQDLTSVLTLLMMCP